MTGLCRYRNRPELRFGNDRALVGLTAWVVLGLLSSGPLLAQTTGANGTAESVTVSETANAVPENPVAKWFASDLDYLASLYIHFHKNPELSFQEENTSRRFAAELRKLDCEVTENVGGFGVVAIMENGPGATVMLRADMDALPIIEQTGLSYASTVKVEGESGQQVGVMHACGHDMHMANLIGVARFLAANKSLWSGTIMFIGQPAEERGSGAIAMLKDGLFNKWPKPDYALAMHVAGQLPAGTIGYRAGYAMANVDSVDITINGRGGHGSTPHDTIDPVVIAARLVLDLQTIVSREVKPLEPAVVTVGSIHGGTKHNIIPDSVHLQLTVRSYTDEVRQQVLSAIERKAQAAAASAGAENPKVTVSEGTPALFNDEELAAMLHPVFSEALGSDNVREREPILGGEDFSQFGRAGVPSVLFFVGSTSPARLERYESGQVPPAFAHTPRFYPEIEETLRTGVVAMGSAMLKLLPRP